MEIVLARHGRPDAGRWPRIAAARMEEWIAHYDAAGLARTVAPESTQAAVTAVDNAKLLVCSTSRRAVESARALAPRRCVLQEAIFCEAALPHARWTMIKLPPQTWAVMFRLAWLLGYHGNVESAREARLRAGEAARRLVQLAQESGSVLLFGHGMMNQLIASELLKLGWRGPNRTAAGYWQTTTYTSEA